MPGVGDGDVVGRLGEDERSEAVGEGGDEGPRFKLRKAVFQIGAAVKQVGTTGSAQQVEATIEILAEARKRIYELLAEGD